MRGAPQVSANVSHSLGIIPADAGSTTVAGLFHCSGKDHPRGCGEHQAFKVKNRVSCGSSPRMRGARLHQPDMPLTGWIIPADAGSTPRAWPNDEDRRDHPRGCGEHRQQACDQINNMGSSPRMRGAPVGTVHFPFPRRIIPADAGSTSAVHNCQFHTRDHPRGCGEHKRLPILTRRDTGSSPRMRGARSG